MAKEIVLHDFAGVCFPIGKPRITLPFADRSYRIYRDSPHRGVDLSPFPGARGQPIKASMSGSIVEVNMNANTKGIGNEIILITSLPFPWGAMNIYGNYEPVNANQPFFMRYGHMDKVNVQPRQRVTVGEQLGTIGNTGLSSGPHLHLEVRVGPYHDNLVIDPIDMFSSWIVGINKMLIYG